MKATSKKNNGFFMSTFDVLRSAFCVLRSAFDSLSEVLTSKFLSSMCVQVILQDDCRGGRVEFLFPFAPVALVDGKAALRLAARQSFVFGDHRHAGPRAQ